MCKFVDCKLGFFGALISAKAVLVCAYLFQYIRICIHNTKISIARINIKINVANFSVPKKLSPRANKQSDDHHECSFLSPNSLTVNLGMDLSLGSRFSWNLEIGIFDALLVIHQGPVHVQVNWNQGLQLVDQAEAYVSSLQLTCTWSDPAPKQGISKLFLCWDTNFHQCLNHESKLSLHDNRQVTSSLTDGVM